MSRRTIIWLLVGLMGVASLSGCARPGQPEWRLAMGAYTLRSFTLLETIDKTHDLGLKYLEAFSWQKIGGDYGDMVFDYKAPAEARQAVRARLDEAGVKLVGYYFHTLGKDEAETRKVFDFCKDMGVATIVSEPEPGDFDLVEKLANEYGINVALHNHPAPSPYWDVKVVHKTVKDRGPRIGACADTGHWARSGLDTVAAARQLEGKIISFHLKDVQKPEKESRDVPWGTGIANIRDVLEQVDRQGFSGIFSIEYEHNPADNIADVKLCIDYFNKIARELGH